MKRLISYMFSSTALAALLALPAAAQEYSNGGICAKGRGPAILTPVEAFGVHPPGPDPADANRCVFRRWRNAYLPYYAPLAPVATSVRWAPGCYFPLMPYYTPYYLGYCPHRLCCPKPAPYGSDGWGQGPMPGQGDPGPGGPLPNYGAYTYIITDDTVFWNMGGNGLVPYGTPRLPHVGSPDLVDAIQASRQQLYLGGGGACAPVTIAAPVTVVSDGAAPAITPPGEKQESNTGDKEMPEKLPPAKPPTEKPATPG